MSIEVTVNAGDDLISLVDSLTQCVYYKKANSVFLISFKNSFARENGFILPQVGLANTGTPIAKQDLIGNIGLSISPFHKLVGLEKPLSYSIHSVITDIFMSFPRD